MKKLKKSIIAGVALLSIGVLMWLIGMFAIGWNFYALDNSKYVEKSYEPETGETITAIEIDFSSNLTVIRGDSVKFDYYEREGVPVDIRVDGTTLKIKEERTEYIVKIGLFNFNGLRYKSVLTIPDNLDLSVTSTNADVEIKGATLNSLKVDSTNLDFALKSSTVLGDASVKSTNVGVEIDDSVIVGELTVNGTNADISVERLNVKSFEIRLTNADIELERLTVDKLTLRSTNLDADIEIVGDRSEYTIKTSGKRLPSPQTGSTEKEIYISGTNNDVSLKFTQNR